jgi:hypothetical protein
MAHINRYSVPAITHNPFLCLAGLKAELELAEQRQAVIEADKAVRQRPRRRQQRGCQEAGGVR